MTESRSLFTNGQNITIVAPGQSAVFGNSADSFVMKAISTTLIVISGQRCPDSHVAGYYGEKLNL